MESQFERLFVCKSCEHEARVEELTKGVMVIECDVCETAELWGETEPVNHKEHFDFVQPVAQA